MRKPKTGLKDFEVHEKLGEGAFSQVYKVKRVEDNQFYAMKKVQIASMSQKDRKNALNQVRLLASEKNSHVIAYKEAFYEQSTHTLCLVMQYAQGGDIARKIRKVVQNGDSIPEQQIWRAMVHIAQGLHSLHSKKIIHRDLKSANVFITSNQIYKVGDLNVSKVLKNDFTKTQIGTPLYIPPQIWKNKSYNYKSDIWSLGCIIYQMAAKRTPFTASDIQGLYRKIAIGNFERIPNQYSDTLWRFIKMMLNPIPQQRPSAEQIVAMPQVAVYYKQPLQINNQTPNNLIQTIKIYAHNIKSLKDVLPNSQYQIQSFSEKQINSNKQLYSPKFRINQKKFIQIFGGNKCRNGGFERRSQSRSNKQEFISNEQKYKHEPIKQPQCIRRLLQSKLKQYSEQKNSIERIVSANKLKPKLSMKRIVKLPLKLNSKDHKNISKQKYGIQNVASCKNIILTKTQKYKQQFFNNFFSKNKIKVVIKEQKCQSIKKN